MQNLHKHSAYLVSVQKSEQNNYENDDTMGTQNTVMYRELIISVNFNLII